MFEQGANSGSYVMAFDCIGVVSPMSEVFDVKNTLRGAAFIHNSRVTGYSQ